MFASDPVSRLSTQITRCSRRSSSSHRCEPRNPAPPVTRQVAIPAVYGPASVDACRPDVTRLDVTREYVRATLLAAREVDALEPVQHGRAAPAAWLALAAVLLDDDGSRHLP